MEALHKPKLVNSETILIQKVYFDCIYATILGLQYLGLYIGYKPINLINLNSRVNVPEPKSERVPMLQQIWLKIWNIEIISKFTNI